MASSSKEDKKIIDGKLLMWQEETMKGKIFLFEWDAEASERRAALLREAGWEVESEWQNGARGGKSVVNNPPDALVLDLAKKASHSYETAEALRWRKSTKYLPMIFVDGERKAIEKTKEKVPDAIFTTSAGLLEAVEAIFSSIRVSSAVE